MHWIEEPKMYTFLGKYASQRSSVLESSCSLVNVSWKYSNYITENQTNLNLNLTNGSHLLVANVLSTFAAFYKKQIPNPTMNWRTKNGKRQVYHSGILKPCVPMYWDRRTKKITLRKCALQTFSLLEFLCSLVDVSWKYSIHITENQTNLTLNLTNGSHLLVAHVLLCIKNKSQIWQWIDVWKIDNEAVTTQVFWNFKIIMTT